MNRLMQWLEAPVGVNPGAPIFQPPPAPPATGAGASSGATPSTLSTSTMLWIAGGAVLIAGGLWLWTTDGAR